MQQPKFWIICLSLIMNELAFEEKNITQRRHSRNICVMISCAGILELSVGARNRVGTGLSYRHDRLHILAESIPWKRFLGSFKV